MTSLNSLVDSLQLGVQDITGVYENPSDLFATPDPLALIHTGLGFAAGLLPYELSMAFAVLFTGYQVSELSKAASAQGTEVFEFGIGMVLGGLIRYMRTRK